MAQGQRLWVPGSPPAPRNDRAVAPLTDAALHDAFTAANLSGDGSPVLLAVSGGPDSTALMHAAAAWPGAPSLLVATVDHGLRPESRAEADAVASQAASLGLPHAILTWADRPARVSQEAARAVRYRLLAAHAAATGARRIATAHTLDDQVETILMRMAAGSGLSGLGGMEAVSCRGSHSHLRPFLSLRKAALVATCRERGWSFVDDPTNSDPRYARPRWRALADLLATEGLTPERVATLGVRLRRADEALDHTAARLAAQTIENLERVMRVDMARLAGEPEEIALRVLLGALDAAGADILRLDRAETAFAALLAAARAKRPNRRTLAGRLLELNRDGILHISPEPPRFRGR